VLIGVWNADKQKALVQRDSEAHLVKWLAIAVQKIYRA
jgi:hypothetical protein